jgi:hypothetical protein
MKNYRIWAKTAAVLMLVTGIFHGLSLFIQATPQNDTERQLLELTTNYRMDAGAGFRPSYSDLFTALSSCLSLLCFFGGTAIFQLIGKGAPVGSMKGFLTISTAIFGICFGMMAWFTFLPPIVCTGLIFVSLIAARLTITER